MDIVAHGLWAAVGVGLARQRWPIARRTAAATVATAVMPDLLQLVPLLGIAIGSREGMAVLPAYIGALPGAEPSLPATVQWLSHHLHCIPHSAVIAGAATLLVWAVTKSFWLPLAGWWSHIVIDFFTHSADFYPAPVLYPFTEWGFDGWAWNTPMALALNYAALVAAGLYLVRARRAA